MQFHVVYARSFSFISRSTLRSAKTLSISTLNQTNIPPKEIVAYNKETQTPVIQKSTESGTIEFYSGLCFIQDSRKNQSL